MTEKQLVLVTGASGYSGGELCRYLLKKRYPIRVLVRDSSRVSHLARDGIQVIPGDIRNPKQVRQALAGVHTVYHLAAEFRRAGISEDEMWQSNVVGTRNMLQAAVEAGVTRFVHCSSVGVHGDVKNPPADESAPFHPNDFYHRTKLEAENIVQDFVKSGEMEISVFRPAGIYGPGEKRFLKLFRSIKRGYFIMLGKGQVWYQMGYIDDILDGIYRCGTMPEAIGEVFILTGLRAYTLNDLVRMVARAVSAPVPERRFPVEPVYAAAYACEKLCKSLGIEPPLFRRRVDFFCLNRSFDISKANQLLGYSPQKTMVEGLQTTAQWYASQNLL
jgi:nucleoside-diphosphate-sugar epimerase